MSINLADEMPSVGRINTPKASDVLAEEIRNLILSGEMAEGDALPTERDLVAQSALSRGSVREALRILELEGLIETRPGRNGGSRVRRPSESHVRHMLSLYIRGSRVRFESLLEVREAIEPEAARLAARHRSETQLRTLRAIHSRMERADRVGDNGAFLEGNLDWHMAVVQASGNELIGALMSALSEAVLRATEMDVFDKPEIRQSVLRAHAAVNQAIADGDPEMARCRMSGHVRAASALAHEDTAETD